MHISVDSHNLREIFSTFFFKAPRRQFQIEKASRQFHTDIANVNILGWPKMIDKKNKNNKTAPPTGG